MMGHLAYQAAIEHVNTLRAAAERHSGRTVHPDRRLRRSKARSWLRHHHRPKLRVGRLSSR
jgi:hypothetical protein